MLKKGCSGCVEQMVFLGVCVMVMYFGAAMKVYTCSEIG